jgi:hypothetical protein
MKRCSKPLNRLDLNWCKEQDKRNNAMWKRKFDFMYPYYASRLYGKTVDQLTREEAHCVMNNAKLHWADKPDYILVCEWFNDQGCMAVEVPR